MKTEEKEIEVFDYSEPIIYKHLYINYKCFNELRYELELIDPRELEPLSEFLDNICTCSLYGNYYFFVTDLEIHKDLFISKLKLLNNKIIDDYIHFISYDLITNREFLSTTFRKINYRPKKEEQPKYTVQFNIINYELDMWNKYNELI